MIYRKLDASGDYTFGKGAGNFYRNSPETVAQAVRTRLGLRTGEWFLDVSVGTPYSSQILGAGTIGRYDAALQQVILGTPGVTRLVSYISNVDPTTRQAQVSCTINTSYGQTTVQQDI